MTPTANAPTIEELVEAFAEALPRLGTAGSITDIDSRFPGQPAGTLLVAFSAGCDLAVTRLTEQYPDGTGVYYGSQYHTVVGVAGACALTIRRLHDPATDRNVSVRDLRPATADDEFRSMAYRGVLPRS